MEHGYFGGYLLVNYVARPLEFHCTMPVKPSRAQELLYGPTIDDFVCGEQIAKALTMKAKLTPQVVLTDCSAVLALSLVSKLPVAYLATSPDAEKCEQMRIPVSMGHCVKHLDAPEYRVDVPEQSDFTQQEFAELVQGIAPSFDLAEPFQRIVEALYEAHPVTRAA